MMSEEAQEARNKEFRFYRRDRARKFSRKATNEDVFNMMMTTSDPIISSLRVPPKKISGSLSEQVVSLLRQPELSGADTEDSENETDSE